MKDQIKNGLLKIKSRYQNISPEQKVKVAGALATAPIIAAGAMNGAFAGGCPYGLSCSAPGQCGRFTDGDSNGLCDLGQTSAATTTTSDSSSQDSGTTTSSSDSADTTYNSQDTGSTVDTTDTSSSQSYVGNSDDGGNATATLQDPGNSQGSDLTDATNYHILPISLLLLGGYLATYYLFKKGILKPQQHKRIWNMLLTFGFVGTGLTGVLLTLMINMGISTVYNPQINYIHAELSVIMVIGTLIHMHIYKKPLKRNFNVLFGRKSRSKRPRTKNNKMMRTPGTSK